ncbi:MAG: hypothetical protein R3E02_00795 [Blastomonas sp.]
MHQSELRFIRRSVTETYYPTSLLPAPYDIVWCRFPNHKNLGNPGPKSRPGLVLNVALYPDEGESEVHVIYGTTNLKTFQRPQDFFVVNAAEMDVCGLDRATRFDLDQMAWLPWTIDWFGILPSYNSPIIGHLSDHAVRLLQEDLAHRKARLNSHDGGKAK